jgi:two-component sensor histidine kinase
LVYDIVLIMAAVVLLILGSRVHALAGRRSATQWFAFYCYTASLISLIEIMAHYSPTGEIARVWGQFGSVWPFAWVFFAHFVFKSDTSNRPHALFLVLVYVAGSVAAGSYFALARTGAVIVEAHDFGFALESPFIDSWLGTATAVSYATVFSITLFALIQKSIQREGSHRRDQVRWILLAFGLGFAPGVGMVLLREIGGAEIRELNGLSYLITACVIYAGIVSRRLAQLTPELVARQALGSIDECFILTDDQYRIVAVNPAASATLGTPQDRVRGRDLRELIGVNAELGWPQDVSVGEGIDPSVVLNLSETLTRNHLGEVIGRVFVGRDVTEARRQEQLLEALVAEKDMLLRELHHRVGNTLQVLDGLVLIKAANLNSPDAVRALGEINHRIHLIATVYQTVYSDGEFQTVLVDRLIRELSEHLAHSETSTAEIELALDLAPISLPVETAIPLLLAVAELVANACRHAYTGLRAETVQVESKASSESEWTVVVSDTGRGMDGELPPTATGLTLADELIRQIGGTLELDSSHGTTCRITFPLPPSDLCAD